MSLISAVSTKNFMSVHSLTSRRVHFCALFAVFPDQIASATHAAGWEKIRLICSVTPERPRAVPVMVPLPVPRSPIPIWCRRACMSSPARSCRCRSDRASMFGVVWNAGFRRRRSIRRKLKADHGSFRMPAAQCRYAHLSRLDRGLYAFAAGAGRAHGASGRLPPSILSQWSRA